MEKKFTDIINGHRGILFKVCNLYCHEDEDRKDLFQEVVIQLWKAFPHFRNDSLVSTWMYRVALNTAISYFRKESKKPERQSISSLEFEIPEISATTDDERSDLLKQAIGQLTRIEKAVIMLYLEEKSYDEISAIIGITKANTGVMLNRIKTKLEKII
ncbi:MAG TPA: sigma-70 family RNA polymerase sigma factor, partial [Agriterribacter sp.]|nr:sigma-70 family RNA polymerase sigma factor [Agriterribacter sp.]